MRQWCCYCCCGRKAILRMKPKRGAAHYLGWMSSAALFRLCQFLVTCSNFLSVCPGFLFSLIARSPSPRFFAIILQTVWYDGLHMSIFRPRAHCGWHWIAKSPSAGHLHCHVYPYCIVRFRPQSSSLNKASTSWKLVVLGVDGYK